MTLIPLIDLARLERILPSIASNFQGVDCDGEMVDLDWDGVHSDESVELSISFSVKDVAYWRELQERLDFTLHALADYPAQSIRNSRQDPH